MQIVIDIPEEEFGIDINDKFQDFFQRLRVEIKEHLISGTGLVCGAYELETIEMFLNAFANSITLSKGHGRLIDVNDLLDRIGLEDNDTNREENVGEIITLEDFDYTPTIIEADESELESEA